MNLWLVVMYMGQVIASVGPLPYDEAECQRRAAEMRADGSLEVKPGAIIDGRAVTQQDITVACVWGDHRPAAREKP